MKRDAKIGLSVILVVCVSLAVVFGRQVAQQTSEGEPTLAGANADDALDELVRNLPDAALTEPEVTAADAVVDDAADDTVDYVEEIADDLIEEADNIAATPPTTVMSHAETVEAAPDAGATVPAIITAGEEEVTEWVVDADELDPADDVAITPPSPADARDSLEGRHFDDTPEVVEVDTDTPPAVAAAPSYRTYTVKSGDSFWKIAKKQLGRGSLYGRIEDLNPGVSSDMITVGQRIRIPSAGTPPAPAVTVATVATTFAAGTREYVVKSGDSFWKIASKELGKGARYGEIEKLNPSLSSGTLRIGRKILIPED